MKKFAEYSKVFIVFLAGGVVSLAWVGYVKFKAEQAKMEMDRTLEIIAQCDRVHLRMTREEVIELMGLPFKEYDVRPSARSGDPFFREMLYLLPTKTTQAPYVDLESETRRVVEIYCTERNHVSMPAGAAGPAARIHR